MYIIKIVRDFQLPKKRSEDRSLSHDKIPLTNVSLFLKLLVHANNIALPHFGVAHVSSAAFFTDTLKMKSHIYVPNICKVVLQWLQDLCFPCFKAGVNFD
jgi:hypothetical protein